MSITHSSIDDERKFGREFLDEILSWIINRFDPEELYGEKYLKEFISSTYSPSEIFDGAELEEAVA